MVSVCYVVAVAVSLFVENIVASLCVCVCVRGDEEVNSVWVTVAPLAADLVSPSITTLGSHTKRNKGLELRCV